MILIYTRDRSFAEELVASIPNREAEVFGDETSLAAAIRGLSVAGIVFDLRRDPRPLKLIERTYLEIPSVAIVAVFPPEGLAEELYFDRSYSWPVEASVIAGAFADIQSDRQVIKECGLVGRSPQLVSAARIVLQVAPSDISVLITGPSGAGKEMIARAIHAKSAKPESPFIPVNIAALAPGLVESELFGHEKGAYTGAIARRLGVFEQASGGAIFLDEIGEIPLEIQVKLLRILESRTFTRVGGNTPIKVDFRLIAATNRSLTEDVATGRIREDLYYRLRVVSIDLPPLAQRKSDISPLTFRFLDERGRELRSGGLEIEPGALRLFHRYDWPGNVRELKNVIDSFAITSSSGRIKASDFERYMMENRPQAALLPVATHRTPESAEHQLIFQAIMALTNEMMALKRLIERELEKMRGGEPVSSGVAQGRFDTVNVEDVERELVTRALNEAGGNRKKAARMLGIGERTLYRKLDKYGLK